MVLGRFFFASGGCVGPHRKSCPGVFRVVGTRPIAGVMTRAQTFLIAAAGASVAVSLLALPLAQAAPSGCTASAAPTERAVIAKINRERLAHGRRALTRIPTLARPARAHSVELRASGTFTHDSADGSPFWRRLVAAGFPRGRRMAENLAAAPGCGAGVASTMVRMWMASPPHRANILDRRMRFVGVGIAFGDGSSPTITTADFGS